MPRTTRRTPKPRRIVPTLHDLLGRAESLLLDAIDRADELRDNADERHDAERGEFWDALSGELHEARDRVLALQRGTPKSVRMSFPVTF